MTSSPGPPAIVSLPKFPHNVSPPGPPSIGSSSGPPKAVSSPGPPIRSTPPNPLSERELWVLRYLPSRMSNREIGAELYVSLNTVKSHLKTMYRKLDVDRRDDAVRRARQLGLL